MEIKTNIQKKEKKKMKKIFSLILASGEAMEKHECLLVLVGAIVALTAIVVNNKYDGQELEFLAILIGMAFATPFLVKMAADEFRCQRTDKPAS